MSSQRSRSGRRVQNLEPRNRQEAKAGWTERGGGGGWILRTLAEGQCWTWLDMAGEGVDMAGEGTVCDLVKYGRLNFTHSFRLRDKEA